MRREREIGETHIHDIQLGPGETPAYQIYIEHCGQHNYIRD